MTPLASVAMLEKLALSKIAFCSAPASSSASSARLLEVLSVPVGAPTRVSLSVRALSTQDPASRFQSIGYPPWASPAVTTA